MESNKTTQVVLASSSTLFLEGIRSIIEDESNIKIVALASNRKEVEKHLTEIKPDFLFLDNKTLEVSVPKLLNLVIKKSPDTKVILFGIQTEDELNSPNIICIKKETNSLELINALTKRKSLNGIPPKEVTHVVKYNLSNMEMKVVELIVYGFSNKQIAKKLSISEKTVKAHLTNIFMKLGLENRYQLIVYARQLNT